jgi:Uma2 family endonuclease
VVSQIQATTSEVFYPDNDGIPMANNTVQFRWIVVIQQNLSWLFADHPNVFIAGDLFWYPIEGCNTIVVAPDILVAFGRPKGDRLSYKQWEENNTPPQVIFEIISPSNTPEEMDKKLLFFDRYGVEEYYIYDPKKNHLRCLLRNRQGLTQIPYVHNWISPRMKIRFDMSGTELQFYRPDGERFKSYAEIAQQLTEFQQQLDQTTQQLDQTTQQLDQTTQQLEQERQRSQALAERLRAMGIDPNQLEA